MNIKKLYAGQKNPHTFDINKDELKGFIGILLFSGYHKLPRERLYWTLDDDVAVDIVTKCMSRNKFTDIKRNLHFADNSLADQTQEKLFKVRPLRKMLEKKFCQWGVFHEELSIGKSMIKYFGHHSAKEFIRGKPVRFGYKNWALTSSTGYCYAFDIYTVEKHPTKTPEAKD